MTLSICLAGATGWTGKALVAAPGLELRSAVSRIGLTRGLDTLLLG